MQHVKALGVFARGLLLFFIFFLVFPPFAVNAFIGGQGFCDIGVVAVQKMELIFLAQQGKILILPVDVDEERTNLTQNRKCHVTAVDKGRTASGFRHLPRNDELTICVINSLLRQDFMEPEGFVIKRKDGFDAQPVATRTHHV